MYFKFNDSSEVVIDINSILYAYMVNKPEESSGIKIILKKKLVMQDNILFIDDYCSNKIVKEDYKRLLKALEI